MPAQNPDSLGQSGAVGAASVVARPLSSRGVMGALRLYEWLRGLGLSPLVIGLRLKAAHALIQGMLPENANAAAGLWREFADLPLTAAQQQRWAQDGLDVIRAFLEQGDRDEAQAAFEALKSAATAPDAQGHLAEAQKLLSDCAE